MDQSYSVLLWEMSFSLPIPSIQSAHLRQSSFLQLSLAVDRCQGRLLLYQGWCCPPMLLGMWCQLHQPTWPTHSPSALLSVSPGQSGWKGKAELNGETNMPANAQPALWSREIINRPLSEPFANWIHQGLDLFWETGKCKAEEFLQPGVYPFEQINQPF